MEFKLSFNMDNAVFEENPELQIAWILGSIAGKINRKKGFITFSASVKDSNGNTIGRVEIE